MSRFEIAQFPARSDNIGVVLHDPESRSTLAIDAPDADSVETALAARGWVLTHILVTHKHFDHIEGIPALKASYDCEVIGPEASAVETGLYDRTVKDGGRIEWGGNEIQVIATPGHTLDHLSYYLPDQSLVFVADTLFSLGCGRVIEGTHAMMWKSLLRLRSLPDDATVYCGHEYTLANAKFALTIEPDNEVLRFRAAEVERLRAAGELTLPTTLGAEIAANPFLRADNPELMRSLGMEGADPAAVFAEIRTRKDRF